MDLFLINWLHDMTGKWVKYGAMWAQCGYGCESQQRKDVDWDSRRDVEAGECRVGAVWREEDWGTEQLPET